MQVRSRPLPVQGVGGPVGRPFVRGTAVRRQLHAVVVGLVAGSLALDTARAGRLGRCRPVMPPCPAPVAVWHATGPCGDVVFAPWPAPARLTWSEVAVESATEWCGQPSIATVGEACDPCHRVTACEPCATETIVADWQVLDEEPACCEAAAEASIATDPVTAAADVIGTVTDDSSAATPLEAAAPPAVERVPETPAESAADAPAVAKPVDAAAAAPAEAATRSVLLPDAPAAEPPRPQPIAEPLPDLKPVAPATERPAPEVKPEVATSPTVAPKASDAPSPTDQTPPVEAPKPPAPAAAPEPAPAPVPAPAPPAPVPVPSKPREVNLFDDEETEAAADDATARPAAEAPPAAVDEAPAPPVPAEPAPTAPAVPAPAPAEPPAPAAEPAPAAPAAPAAAEPAPAAAAASELPPLVLEPDGDVVPATAKADLRAAPEPVSPVEVPPLELMPAPEALTVRRPVVPPLRRWVDETGLHATVGRFVAVRDEAVEIRKSNGRLIRVPLERLSQHDRDYVAAAAGPSPEPATGDTVGM